MAHGKCGGILACEGLPLHHAEAELWHHAAADSAANGPARQKPMCLCPAGVSALAASPAAQRQLGIRRTCGLCCDQHSNNAQRCHIPGDACIS